MILKYISLSVSFKDTHRQFVQVERGDMGTIFRGKAVFLTYQEHVVNAATCSSNEGKYDPSESTCPGCGQIITKARRGKSYKWSGRKRTKLKIPPESSSATSEQTPPTVSCNSLQPESYGTTT